MFVYQRVTKQKMRRTQKHIRCLQKPGWPCWPWRGWVWKSRGSHHIWLVVDLPIWKIWVRQLAWLFPICGKIKNVPNHQPDIIWIEESTITIAPKGWVSWVSCVHGIKSHMAVGRRPVQKLFERKFIWRALVVCSEKFEVIFSWHAGTKGRRVSILQVSSACFRMVSTLTIVWPRTDTELVDLGGTLDETAAKRWLRSRWIICHVASALGCFGSL